MCRRAAESGGVCACEHATGKRELASRVHWQACETQSWRKVESLGNHTPAGPGTACINIY